MWLLRMKYGLKTDIKADFRDFLLFLTLLFPEVLTATILVTKWENVLVPFGLLSFFLTHTYSAKFHFQWYWCSIFTSYSLVLSEMRKQRAPLDSLLSMSLYLCVICLPVHEDVWLSDGGADPFWNTLFQHLQFSSHPLSLSRSWSCKGPSPFPPLRPGGWHISQGNMQKEASEEGKENESKGTRQHANVNQNLEGKQVWGKAIWMWAAVLAPSFSCFPCHPQAASPQPKPVLLEQCESFCSPSPPLPPHALPALSSAYRWLLMSKLL